MNYRASEEDLPNTRQTTVQSKSYSATRKALTSSKPILSARNQKAELNIHMGWIQLWPIEPITAPTAQEARDKALSLLEIAAGKSQDELFEKRAFPVPLHQKKIEEVHSPTHRALAWIIKHDEKRFEVRYFGVMVDDEQEEEWRLSIPAVDGMPVREGYAMLTLASTLEDAERAAVLELETIVYTGEIKARHP